MSDTFVAGPDDTPEVHAWTWSADGHNATHLRSGGATSSINARALLAMFKQIIANNRAGGWRTLKRER